MDEKPDKPRFRFSITLALLLTALIASLLATWTVWRRTAARQRPSDESIRPGMAAEDVVRIMRAPDTKYKTWPGRNLWVYRFRDPASPNGLTKMEVVVNDDGLVIEVREDFQAPKPPDPFRPSGPILINGR
jgi:hypothetical protein